MVRRVILGAVVAGVLAVVPLFAQGCGITFPADLGSNCPPGLPLECCQCHWPEDCPPYTKNPEPVPDWCGPYLCDAGCPGPFGQFFISDFSRCEECKVDGGVEGDGGMMSFCSSGACVPSAPDGWKHVSFVMSWPEAPPACPEDAPVLAFEGSPAPPERSCPACSCDPPEGKCNLPTKWTVKTVGCNDPAPGIETPFDAQNPWDGTCTDANSIALGKLCGGVPCVRSVSIAPPVIEEQPCVARTEGEADLPIPKAWSDGERMPTGRACISNEPLSGCSGKGCGSTNSEFGACIMHEGDQVCPDGWSGERHVLYGQIEDSRECSPCGCDAPSGGVCQVKWTTFSTSTCSIDNASGDVYAGDIPGCANLMPGVAIAGKTAEIVDYTKGKCTPMGGDLVGNLNLDKQQTICCFGATM